MIQQKKPDVIVAIDPDVDGSGVAQMYKRDLVTERMTLPRLADFLRTYGSSGTDILVVVEASYLISANWHLQKGDSTAKAAAKGKNVGRNHEIGRQIVEFCRHYQIPYEEKIPLKKIWKGKDGKITREELVSLCEGSGIHYHFASNDQEQRDAALLAIDRSGIPMIMLPAKSSKHKEKPNL